jgi:hypothetical protein
MYQDNISQALLSGSNQFSNRSKTQKHVCIIRCLDQKKKKKNVTLFHCHMRYSEYHGYFCSDKLQT